MAIFIPRWEKYKEAQAPENPEVKWSNSINDGLKSFFIFRRDLYGTNFATGEIDQIEEVGTGVNWADDGSYIETKNSSSDYIKIPHGITPGVGISGFVADYKVSGNVCWSMMGDGSWTGIYSEDDVLKSTSSSSFDGEVSVQKTLSLDTHAFSYDANDFRAVSVSGLSVDSSAIAMSHSVDNVTLGLINKNPGVSNPSQTRFKHMGFYDRILSDEEKLELHLYPYQGLKKRRKFWAMPSGATGTTSTTTGTVTASITEADIVTGGKTTILTLTNDTWVADDGTFAAVRQAIIDKQTSAQTETFGWNNEVRDKASVTDVARTDDNTVTITWGAAASYDITAQETITPGIPASALVTSTIDVVSSPTFTVDIVASSFQAAWAAKSNKLLGSGFR